MRPALREVETRALASLGQTGRRSLGRIRAVDAAAFAEAAGESDPRLTDLAHPGFLLHPMYFTPDQAALDRFGARAPSGPGTEPTVAVTVSEAGALGGDGLVRLELTETGPDGAVCCVGYAVVRSGR